MSELRTSAAKLFASAYALLAGLVFVALTLWSAEATLPLSYSHAVALRDPNRKAEALPPHSKSRWAAATFGCGGEPFHDPPMTVESHPGMAS